MTLASCRQVPDDTLDNRDNTRRADNEEQLDAEAAAAAAEITFQTRPRTITRVEQSAELYAQALEDDEVRSYEILWKAARVSAWLAQWHGDDEVREKHARQGLKYANTALKLEPEGNEATYHHAVLAGFLGELDNSYGLDAVDKIREAMEKLIERDFEIDHAGPWRVYGMVLMKTPGPPIGFGSLRNARRMMNEMLERAPDWPENHLYYAEFEFTWGADRNDKTFADSAGERLETHFLGDDAAAPEGYEFEFEQWRKAATELIEQHGE